MEGDAAVHYSGNAYCEWSVEYNGNTDHMVGSFKEGETEVILFKNDSEHILTVTCWDLLGNEMTDVERFLVDMLPPETEKEYGQPMVWDEIYRWVTSQTPITLTADDAKIGVHELFWRYKWVGDEMCEAYPARTGNYEHNNLELGGEYPSTNELNKKGENPHINGVGPHFNIVGVGEGYVEVEFNMPHSYNACFGYRSDGDISQAISDEHYYWGLDDDLYPYTCVNSGTETVTLYATQYVEIRLTHGAERNWDFNWTKIYVEPNTTGFNSVEDDEVTFTIGNSSCHMIEYFAVDKFGNMEEIQRQFVMVDNEAPNGTKLIGSPSLWYNESPISTYFDGSEFSYHRYVSQYTPITLMCEDVMPHPVGYEKIYFKVYNNGTNITSNYCDLGDGQEYCVVDANEYTFNFKEDSEHVLKFYCEDALENRGYEDVQFYFVDTEDPITTHEIIGPQFYNEENGAWYINGVTKINLSAMDPEPHPSGVNRTYYTWYTVPDYMCESSTNRDYDSSYDVGYEFWLYQGPFSMEESCHVVKYFSVDNLGNEEDTNSFYVFVDKTAPNISKTYDGHYYEQEMMPLFDFDGFDRFSDGETDVSIDDVELVLVKWISTSTDVVVHVNDPKPHPSGLNYTKYRWTQMPNDMYCWTQNVDGANGTGDWTMFDDASYNVFNAPGESCHLLEIKSVDNVNKTAWHKQLVFVDDTAPEPAKVVGEPKSDMSDENINLGSLYYQNFDQPLNHDFCAEDDMNCLQVTLLTPVTLACEDEGPHPSGIKKVHFKIYRNGEDVTSDYCEVDLAENGYCSMYYDGDVPPVVYFQKTSWHKIDYYCEDNVGNIGGHDKEYIKVDETAFNLSFKKKWNLISVPVRLMDNSLDTLFGGNDDVHAIWTYGTDGEWYVWPQNGPNNLDTMEPGYGYWVLTMDEFDITIGGELFSPGPVAPPMRQLINGWNLIGHYGVEGAPTIEIPHPNGVDTLSMPYYAGPNLNGDGRLAYCALNSMNQGDVSTLYTHWDSTNYYLWSLETQYMNPGAGYWLFYKGIDGALYAPSTICPLTTT
jgi:hypothetical protein